MSILVAVSDDDSVDPVLTVALELATGLDQRLQVTHVTSDRHASTREREFRSELEALLGDVDGSVDVELAHLGQSGLRPGTTVGTQLLELAQDVEVDHIVMGHHSKSRLASVREGHTDFAVVDEAAVPVTIVPARRSGSD
jgi:nucleotide-binding universal stress UspA family protein